MSLFNTIEINSFSEIEQILITEGFNLSQYVFRGEDRIYDSLEPTLERYLKKGYAKSFLESFILDEVKNKYPTDFEPIGNDINKFIDSLSKLQHHGAPTRLLDVTKSLDVAKCFSLIEIKDSEVVIYAFNKEQLRQLMDTLLTRNTPDYFPWAKGIDPILNYFNYLGIGAFFFEPVKTSIERIKRQQGAFIISGNSFFSFKENLQYVWNPKFKSAHYKFVVNLSNSAKEEEKKALSQKGISIEYLMDGQDYDKDMLKKFIQGLDNRIFPSTDHCA